MKTLIQTFHPLHFIFCLSLVLSNSSFAQTTLNGVATHSELGKEKFIAALYLSRTSASAESIFSQSGAQKMEIRVLDEQLSSRRFKRMWIESIAINSNSAELQKQAKSMADFSNLLNIKLKKNDIFAITKLTSGLSITLNNVKLGEIKDTSFFSFLLRTWIGYVPLSSSFKEALLASGNIDVSALQRFESVQPSAQRIASIKAAIQAREEQERAEQLAREEAAKEAARKAEQARLAALATPTPAPKRVVKSTPKPKPTPTPTPKNIASLPKPGSLDESFLYNLSDSAASSSQAVAAIPKQNGGDDSLFEATEDSENLTAEGLLGEQLYYSHLASYTQTFARYPRKAQENNQQGSLLLRVTIDRKGKVLNKEIVEKTKFELLNKESLRAIDRASPYPPIPVDIKGEEFTFTFRLTFNLRET
ncbi:hypothetical protein TDB9533_04123 [Thalassocella blandensis]|nr:hypothetical protein TDB9533_04123 [Thalassocella blandensis]